MLLHWTPFHSQQLSPPHDDRRFAGSERPALKARRADRSWAVHLLSVSFLWVDASGALGVGKNEQGYGYLDAGDVKRAHCCFALVLSDLLCAERFGLE